MKISHNPALRTFLDKLEAVGVEVKPLNEYRLPDDPRTLHTVLLRDAKANISAIIFDMGADGYQLFTERPGLAIVADVQAVQALLATVAGLDAGTVWEAHTGEDYTVVMAEDENTENASIRLFGERAPILADLLPKLLNATRS